MFHSDTHIYFLLVFDPFDKFYIVNVGGKKKIFTIQIMSHTQEKKRKEKVGNKKIKAFNKVPRRESRASFLMLKGTVHSRFKLNGGSGDIF